MPCWKDSTKISLLRTWEVCVLPLGGSITSRSWTGTEERPQLSASRFPIGKGGVTGTGFASCLKETHTYTQTSVWNNNFPDIGYQTMGDSNLWEVRNKLGEPSSYPGRGNPGREQGNPRSKSGNTNPGRRRDRCTKRTLEIWKGRAAITCQRWGRIRLDNTHCSQRAMKIACPLPPACPPKVKIWGTLGGKSVGNN